MTYKILTEQDIIDFGAESTGVKLSRSNFVAGLEKLENDGWLLICTRGWGPRETLVFHRQKLRTA